MLRLSAFETEAEIASAAGEWASLQPDFIVVSRRDDGSLAASIVDPHGDYLADARGKVKALADFAERFGNPRGPRLDAYGLARTPHRRRSPDRSRSRR